MQVQLSWKIESHSLVKLLTSLFSSYINDIMPPCFHFLHMECTTKMHFIPISLSFRKAYLRLKIFIGFNIELGSVSNQVLCRGWKGTIKRRNTDIQTILAHVIMPPLGMRLMCCCDIFFLPWIMDGNGHGYKTLA